MSAGEKAGVSRRGPKWNPTQRSLVGMGNKLENGSANEPISLGPLKMAGWREEQSFGLFSPFGLPAFGR